MISIFSSVEEQQKYMFPANGHPNNILDREIYKNINDECSILDIGCGRSASNLIKFIGKNRSLFGIDVIDFDISSNDIILHQNDVCNMTDIRSNSIDVAYSRAVMEHIENPIKAIQEIYRVLKPGGIYIFTTPSIYDYGSVMALLIPNSFHGKIVHMIEGREIKDVFPTVFKFNSRRAISRISKENRFFIRKFEYIGQYPSYFKFNRILFFIASMYQKIIEKFSITRPLQGWIFCILEKK